VKPANHRIVICKVRTRPKRSDSAPAIQPPSADEISVTPLIAPACVWSMP